MTNPMAEQQLPIACPKCHEQFYVSAQASIPGTQRLSVSLEFTGPNIAATTVGDTITNTSKLMQAAASEIGGNVAVMIDNIDLQPGKLTVGFLILSVKKESER